MSGGSMSLCRRQQFPQSENLVRQRVAGQTGFHVRNGIRLIVVHYSGPKCIEPPLCGRGAWDASAECACSAQTECWQTGILLFAAQSSHRLWFDGSIDVRCQQQLPCQNSAHSHHVAAGGGRPQPQDDVRQARPGDCAPDTAPPSLTLIGEPRTSSALSSMPCSRA